MRTVTLDVEMLVCDVDVEPPLVVLEQTIVFVAQVAPDDSCVLQLSPGDGSTFDCKGVSGGVNSRPPGLYFCRSACSATRSWIVCRKVLIPSRMLAGRSMAGG